MRGAHHNYFSSAVFCMHTQLAALVFYILCETVNKNQFVLNFVVCIVLLAMDFWTVRGCGVVCGACAWPSSKQQQPTDQTG